MPASIGLDFPPSASAPVAEASRRWAPSARTVLAVVGVVALVLRLALLLRAPAFIIADSDNYYYPGYQLARGIGFELDLRRTPGYPVFVALTVDGLGEDLSALLLAQHLLGIGTCLLTAWLGLGLFGRWPGLLAGLMAACAAPLLTAEHYVMAEALFIPLFMLALAALWRALETRGRWPLFVSGVAIGIASLARPVGLILAVALGLALLWDERQLRRTISRGLPAAAGLALVMLPWMARNAAVHGSFSAEGSLGQTLVGRTMRHDRGFAFANSDDPDPVRQRARAIMRDGRGSFVSPVRERLKRELVLSDAEANGLMRDLAVEAIARQPGYYLGGTLSGFARLVQGVPERPRDHWATRRDARSREEWEAHPEIRQVLGPPSPIQEEQYAEAEALLSLYQPARFGLLLAGLAIVGAAVLVRSRHRATSVLISLATVGILLASAALVAPLPRYRYPVEPLVGLLAAGGMVAIAKWGQSRLVSLKRVR